MPHWLHAVLSFLGWIVLILGSWTVIAIGGGIILGRVIYRRDQQRPTDIDVDCRFAEMTGVTTPALREQPDRFQDGVR